MSGAVSALSLNSTAGVRAGVSPQKQPPWPEKLNERGRFIVEKEYKSGPIEFLVHTRANGRGELDPHLHEALKATGFEIYTVNNTMVSGKAPDLESMKRIHQFPFVAKLSLINQLFDDG